MSSLEMPRIETKHWRIVTFMIVAGLFVLVLFYAGIPDLLDLPGQPGFPSIIHRWHEAEAGVMTVILFGGSMLVLLWKPLRNVVLAQFLVLGIAIVALGFTAFTGAGFNPLALLAGAVFISMFLAVYPSVRALRSFSREGSPSLLLLALSIIAAVLLAPVAWQELHMQMVGMSMGDVHALNYHWLSSVALSLWLVLAGLLSATKRPGWHILGFLTGSAFFYLGAAASALPDYAGSWGTTGGMLAMLGGLGYVFVTLFEMRMSRQKQAYTKSTTV